MVQDSISKHEESGLTLKRLMAKWSQTGGNGEKAWLRHLLGPERVEMMHLEIDTSSAAEDLHHWVV